jgi:hypothetical protein
MSKAMSQAIDTMITDPSVSISQVTSAMMGTSPSSQSYTTNDIHISVDGANNPEDTANAIYNLLKLQGVF